MGDKMEDFDYNLSRCETMVVWDFQRYPLPDDADPLKIYSNIISYIDKEHNMRGAVTIFVYGLQQDTQKSKWFDDTRCVYQIDDNGNGMILDILCGAKKNHVFSMNIALIAKENESDKELLRILNAFASRNHNVWLVEPPVRGRPFDFKNAHLLLRGSRPQSKNSSLSHQQIKKHDNFIEDFSLPLLPISGPHAGVVWDAEDYPFPYEDPDSRERGIDAEMSIWAYVDDTEEYWKDKLVKKTWDAHIYFIPRGDRRMLHNFLLYVEDTPSRPDSRRYIYPSYTIVISNKPRTSDETFWFYLTDYHWYHSLVYTIKPSSDVPEEPWPKRVLDKVKPFFYEESHSENEQGCPKKHKLG